MSYQVKKISRRHKLKNSHKENKRLRKSIFDILMTDFKYIKRLIFQLINPFEHNRHRQFENAPALCGPFARSSIVLIFL